MKNFPNKKKSNKKKKKGVRPCHALEFRIILREIQNGKKREQKYLQYVNTAMNQDTKRPFFLLS